MRLLYLIGEPGIGKTTAMAAFTKRWSVLGELSDPGRVLLADGRGAIEAVELGRRRPGGFSGTDALAMNAITGAEQYLLTGQAHAETPLLLAEGARLANRRFLSAAVATGWKTHLVYLHGPDLAAQRRAQRGTGQNEAWVRGAATRARRLAEEPPPGVRVHRFDATYLDAALQASLRWLAGLTEPNGGRDGER